MVEKRPFCTKPRHKQAAEPTMSFRPEERTSATTGGGEPGANQPQQKQDSIADDIPGENSEPAESEFNGQGDYARRGEKQPILDFTPCTWMAEQLLSGEMGEGLPQGAVAETREGELLVSVSVCRECEHEDGCYGLTEDQVDDKLNKEASRRGQGISPEMPEILVAEKIARLKMAEDDGLRFLIHRGFSAPAAMGVMRLVEGIRR